MISILDRLCKSFLGVIAGPLCDIVDAIKAVWKLLMAFFNVITGEWGKYGAAIRAFFTHLNQFISTVEGAIWRVITRAIPGYVKAFWKVAWANVRTILRLAVAQLMRSLQWVQHLAEVAIGVIWRFLRPFAEWATRYIGSLWKWLVKYGLRITDLVIHPIKLVTWLLPHIMGPLMRFILAKRVAIGRWFLNASLRFTLSTASVIESVLVKII